MFKYIVVGAGFSGTVIAERIANVLGEKVLVIDKKPHIGGSCYDSVNDNGVLIHNYGPHIFHTKQLSVWDYVSRYTDWVYYHHRVLGVIDGQLVPIPFNLRSINSLFPKTLAEKLEKKLVDAYGCNVKVPILKLREQKDSDLDFLADYVYEKVFLHYTQKQWGFRPEEMDGAVTARVPVYVSNDDRYFQDPYQGMPKAGYTRIFEKMLNNRDIKLMLNTDYREVLQFDPENGAVTAFGSPFDGKLIFTGQIDELFGYCYGELPYRSVDFRFETHEKEWFQPVGTVNYPNDYTFTRITEFKRMTAQQSKYTTVLREYPKAYDRKEEGAIPFYPIVRPENQELYHKYKVKADGFSNLVLLGRLADYRYYDMDVSIARALEVFEELKIK